MADDAAPIVPDETTLEARARAAGVDLGALGDLARLDVLRSFYTAAERRTAEAAAKKKWAPVVQQYNAWVDANGFWNADIKPW